MSCQEGWNPNILYYILKGGEYHTCCDKGYAFMNHSRLKLMLFSHICSGEHITGAEKLLLFFVDQLKSEHECTLVVPNEGQLAYEARNKGIRTLVQNYPLLWEMYTPSFSMNQAEQMVLEKGGPEMTLLTNLLTAERPDVVVANTCINALLAIAARQIGIPVAWIITEIMTENEYTSLSIQAIDRYANWIIGISEASLRSFRPIIDPDKLFILYPFFDKSQALPELWPSERCKRRNELGLTEQQTVIGYISSDIYPSKGLDHFIQMTFHLNTKWDHARFMIIGRPTDIQYYQECRKLAENSPWKDRFHFIPFDKHIHTLYPAMDVVVVPSLVEEGFGMTALESMGFGKAVVAYESGGLREIFLNTNNQASLVPKGKPAQLAAVVEPWLEHKEACKQQGIQNAAAAEAFFGITAFRSRLHIILNRIQEQLLRWQADGTGPLVSPVPSGKIPVQKVPSIVHRKRRKKKTGKKVPGKSRATYTKSRWRSVNQNRTVYRKRRRNRRNTVRRVKLTDIRKVNL
ncbi:glycosyltransferase family 4 protein [Paenibacillus larvae]|nr:glycosyltransferase family 4 protein [Paenibacillus larvae]ETK27782.1 extracellular matrix biosynthesis-like protein [Paenibacillus larvae subsp. larvae DSM 25719]AVF21156.1 extracellular matrix biosynthesis-like protein [Paenibacillus larvae subsp. larvae]MCY7478308.1 glycosyltransferase family 4 protein [Paenibacillus larvae]MCY7491401.1 glycosyltransferase family 4 protein [Paenibacillus larvae]MCY9564584.1 glycosyltransferase family 4 protein [Paenibacillus larvae]